MWAKGYGTEALSLWTEYLFAAFPQIVRLDLQTWSGNLGMMRLANKLGYQLEARLRKARIVNGAYYNHGLWLLEKNAETLPIVEE